MVVALSLIKSLESIVPESIMEKIDVCSWRLRERITAGSRKTETF